MNNEIKEILDRLERIDHKEYSCGFEFADSGSFDEDCRCFEERKKMANYITNLQQENQKFQERIEYLERSNNRREDTIIEQRQEISDLEDNWNKLKEYAKEIISTDNELYGTDLLDKMQELEGSGSNE